jgi:branched-chain amino acid transport system permease protein
MTKNISGEKDNRTALIVCAVIGLFLFLLPALLPRFYVYLASIILLTGLLATSLNFVLGYGGVFQFHHCVFYGAGAYATALMLTKGGFSLWLGFLMGPIVGAILGFILAVICVRLSKLYFGMLQISLGSLVWVTVYRWYSFTGGDDGIHGIPMPDLLSSPNSSYYFTLLVTILCLVIMFIMVKSPFGSALQGIRDNPGRSEMIGINVKRHQVVALTIAGFFAGVAGALFVVVDNTVFPDMLFWSLSLEVFIMCLLGGWFTFLGPMLGAAVIVSLRTFVSTFTVYWAMVLGIIFMFVIFFLPTGVLGYIEEKLNKMIIEPTIKE